jgi:UDP-galactopyranose mutase
MYPVRDAASLATLARYESLGKQQSLHKYCLGGRLAEYKYYDMHQVIGAALNCARRIEKSLMSTEIQAVGVI